jgi:L-ascorbate metabolism protein UlaG (beta-lactamase superfamily)
MDLQFYGANCLSLTHKGTRIVIDDNLADLGAKSITKADDGPGEYEVADISVIGIAAQAHIDGPKTTNATIFKLVVGDLTVLVTGHIYPELNDAQLEKIGIVDVLIMPVGGNGYTVDPVGGLKLIKAIEPKAVIPTHYADKALNFTVPQQDLANALKELGMEPSETVSKLKVKPSELSDVAQLIVLEKS